MTAPVQPDTTVDDETLEGLDFDVQCEMRSWPDGRGRCKRTATSVVASHCAHRHRVVVPCCTEHVRHFVDAFIACLACRPVDVRRTVDSIEPLR